MLPLFCIIIFQLNGFNTHGWLDFPVARSSIWFYNKKLNTQLPAKMNHDEMNCGGFEVFVQNGKNFQIHI